LIAPARLVRKPVKSSWCQELKTESMIQRFGQPTLHGLPTWWNVDGEY